MEPLMTLKDAAVQLAVAPRTLRRWADKGWVGAVRMGRVWRFRREDVRAAQEHGVPVPQVGKRRGRR